MFSVDPMVHRYSGISVEAAEQQPRYWSAKLIFSPPSYGGVTWVACESARTIPKVHTPN